MVNELLKEVKILYVEDDDSIRLIVERGIKRRVKELEIAVNGEDGLEKFKEFDPDIVLTDIKMPKMDGLEMSKRIKEINPSIPIIIMSAHSESDFLLKSIEMGIDGYLLKPIDKDKMFEKLIYAAKDVLYEKHERENRKLIQELIDLQPSIIFSADEENRLLFVNNTFLEFFCCKSKTLDLEDKALNMDQFLDEFCDKNILETKIDNKNWINYILTNPSKSVKIEFTKNDVLYNFLIKSKAVEYENGQKHIIMTLTNING